jgi:hypothetical protein
MSHVARSIKNVETTSQSGKTIEVHRVVLTKPAQLRLVTGVRGVKIKSSTRGGVKGLLTRASNRSTDRANPAR